MAGKTYRGRVYATKPIADRFWPKVCVIEGGDDCWLWTGCKQKSGYGRIGSSDPSKPVVEGAHRIAYELQQGPIPVGMQVLHRCDVPACCRGSHLFLGTVKDNMDDRDAKGRGTAPPTGFGENSASAILSESQVKLILASKDTHKSLGIQFGVSTSTIKAVRDGITWAHIGESRAPLGRVRSGEGHGRAKLTVAAVRQIRSSAEPARIMADQFAVSISSISSIYEIRSGRGWKNVE